MLRQKWIGFLMVCVGCALVSAVAGADEGYARRVAGGDINGYPVDESHFVIRVAPGEPITGTINVETHYHTGTPGAVVPLGYTVDWGLREDQAVLTNSNMPHAPTTHAVTISKTAPLTPGTYHIIVAFAGRYTIDQVMSETKQDVPGNPIWYDGNDVGFDWTCEQLNDALFVGTVDSQFLGTQGYAWSRIGATAVIVHVEGDEVYVRRVAGGSLNGNPIDETHYEIWANAGESISGTICVETYYAGSPGAVVPFGYTVDWGLREVQAVSNGTISHAPTTRCVTIDTVAPSQLDDHHIILAMAGRYTIDQVMSETKQDVPGNPIWYDGNDVGFDWTCEQFADALFVGTVDSQTLTLPGYFWGRMGAGAVLVHVTGTDCNGNGIADEQDLADCDGSPWCSDCNGNGVPDGCDVADCDGSIWCGDCNGNGTPDECDLADCDGGAWCSDCNGDGVIDACDVSGSLISWGLNGDGQTDVPSGSDFTAVTAGRNFGCALKTVASIVCWGGDDYGQITGVPSGSDFVAIAAGNDGSHVCAINADGSLECWGLNGWGQASPPAGNDFEAISAGQAHSCALRTDGSIDCWGWNNFGQAVDPPGSDYAVVSCGGNFNLAIKTDSSVYAWGRNNSGQTSVPDPNTDFVTIAGGGNHSLAIKADGSLACWGWNDDGQCNVPAGNDYVAVAGGAFHSLALKSDGTIVGWGSNANGQLDIPNGSHFAMIAAGDNHSLALRVDCNSNGVPDECDPDCNGNGIPDECDIADCDGSPWCSDCNGNQIPDGCEPDCNDNDTADECDIADCDGSPWCSDCNNNDIPDECELNDVFTDDLSTFDTSTWTHYGGDNVDVDNVIPDAVYVDAARNWEPASRITHVMSTGSYDFEACFDMRYIGGDQGRFNVGWCVDNDFAYIQDHSDFSRITAWWDSSFVGLHFGYYGRVSLVGSDEGESLGEGPVFADMPLNEWHTVCFRRNGTTLTGEVWTRGFGTKVGEHSTELPNRRSYEFFHISTWDNLMNSKHTYYEIDDVRLTVDADCNGNGVPDECELIDNDCNENGIPDECDIATATSEDCNENSIPDECELDGNDCNANEVPDECELDRVLFEDDFASDLSQWTIVSEGDNTYNAEIVFGEGNPEPALLLDDLASYHCFANSNTTFSHVGRVLEISVDFKHGNAGSTLQRHATFRLTGLDGLLDHDFFIAGMGVSASTNPSYPNTVNCTLRYDDNGADAWETSGFLPIPSGDGWHRGTMVIRQDERVEFYLDNELVYTSTNPIISRFDGQEVVQLGSRRSFYDNVRVVARGENDCNNNGIPDECEIDESSTGPGGPFFCDPAAPPVGLTECDPECNENGIPDECELDGNDCNDTGIPDECELIDNDCNDNGVPDECDITDATSADCQPNGIPDECELDGNDCNANEVPDECEINENSTATGGPFYCDPADPPPPLTECDPDCNTTGTPDECDPIETPIPPEPPHDARKNRYLSITPGNSTSPVAIQVTLTSMKRCTGDDRRACEVDADCPGVCDLNHDWQCEDDAICGVSGPCVPTIPCVEHDDVGNVTRYIDEPFASTCFPNDDCVDQMFAHLRDDPLYREWPESVLHVTDCEIVPVAMYEIRAAICELVSDLLEVGTIEKPQVHYADVCGPVEGGTFTPPDGFVNVTDVQAYLIANQGGATAPHTTWVDLHSSSSPVVPQQILNVGDLQTIKFGFLGVPYNVTPGHEDPGDCP